MARIKLKCGRNEIEIDSRDFYLDNKTIGDLIADLSRHMDENIAKNTDVRQAAPPVLKPNYASLELLDDAEVFEPEFTEPRHLESHQIKSKLGILDDNKFFDSPRTVTEVVQQLRELGWIASPLDVSKSLAKMASNKEISKRTRENRTYYFARTTLLTV